MIAAPASIVRSGRVPHSSQSRPRPQPSAVYSSGAITEAGERRNASVGPHWPSAPVTPSAASSGQCAGCNGTQRGHAAAVANTLSISSSQNTMLCVLSLRPSTRTAIADSA